MFGRIGRILLAALVTEVGGALIQAGRGWVERKLNPPAASATVTPEAPLSPAAERKAG